MPQCDSCGTTIIFGGVKEGVLRFCNDKCRTKGALLVNANRLPDDVVVPRLVEIHQGACPRCGRSGPIEAHTSHYIWSALVITSWWSKPQVCCRVCGVKSKLGGAAFSFVFGWWGIPTGILATPIVVLKNVFGVFYRPDPSIPSAALERIVRIEVAEHLAVERHRKRREAALAAKE